MKIGIIVYSHTGNTLGVATRLTKRLATAGHEVTLAQIETVTPLQMGDTTAELKTAPPVAPYDALVFATPVRGGTPAPPMRVYLEQLPSLAGKDVVCLVTGLFPAGWGRVQTLAQMQTLCEAKGGRVLRSGGVGWLSPNRGRQIKEVVEKLSRAF